MGSADAPSARAADPRRYLKVLAHAEPGDSFGSGYLLADGLALTAAHVLAGSSRIEVRSPSTGWTPASVEWTDPVTDLALLRLAGQPDPPGPVPLGRLDGRTAMEFSAVGYPAAQAQALRGEQLRDSEQLLGFLAPQSYLETGRIALHANSGAPTPMPDGRSPWAGMSGAAVIVAGTVVAVVVHDPAAFGPDRLVGQPVAPLWDDARSAAILREAGVVGVALEPEADVSASLRRAGERIVGERISTAVEMFTDRSELRALLRDALVERRCDLLAVYGRRGIGKSALVARVMADLESDPQAGLDGVCYLSSRTGSTMLDLARVLGSAARLLPPSQRDAAEGVIASAGHTPAERCAFVLDALAERRWVMVLDDLDPFQDATGEITGSDVLTFLQAVARAVSPPMVLLTSRRAPLLPDSLMELRAVPVEMVEGIPGALGADLLVRLDSMGQAGMAQLPQQVRADLVDAVHGVPRALELLVGLRARNPLLPVDRLVERLLHTPKALDALMSTTYSELPEAQLGVVRILSVFGVPVDAGALEQQCARHQPGPDYESAVVDLVSTRVLGLDVAAGRVRLHPLDAEVVIEGLPPDGPWSLPAIATGIAEWYCARTAPPDAWRTGADIEAPLAEARQRIRARDADRAVEVLLALARSGTRGGEGPAVLALLASVQPQLHGAGQRARHALATAYARHVFGPNEAAIAAGRDAAELFAHLGETELQAEALSIHGDALRYAGRFGEAVASSTESLALTGSHSSDPVRAVRMLRLGLAHAYAGHHEDAARTAAAITALDEAGTSPELQAFRCDLASLAQLLAGETAAALALAQEGAEHYAHSTLEPENACYVHNVAGLAYLQLGDPQSARAEFERGLGMARELRLPRAEAFNAFNLTWALVLCGQAAPAGDAARRAAEAFLEDGGQEVAAARALHRCLSEIRAGNADAALALLDEVAAATAANPELHSPSQDALGALRALIRAASDAARAS